MTLLAKIHFSIGALFFGIFLLTGVYMIFNFPELYAGREEVRMMYRATHIYILMSALVNLMTGSYLLNSHNSSFQSLRKIASILILATPPLFFTAFVYEPNEYLIDRPFAFWGVLFLLIGVMLHTLLNIKWLTKKFA